MQTLMGPRYLATETQLGKIIDTSTAHHKDTGTMYTLYIPCYAMQVIDPHAAVTWLVQGAQALQV